MAEESASQRQDEGHALFSLGRSLVAHAKAKVLGKGHKGKDLQEAVRTNPLANVYVSPTAPLLSLCRSSNVNSVLQNSLVGFDASLLSEQVVLSLDGRAARHLDPSSDLLFGIVFGSSAIPRFAEGAYFEVEITGTRECQSDGLTIGVTTSLPGAPELVPEAADALPDSWSFGYDGYAKISGSSAMIPISWSSSGLSVGDSVGLLIDPEGRPHLFVNRSPVPCRLPGTVPMEGPLFPFVDLLGNAREVLLQTDATPPGASSGSALSSASTEVWNPHLPVFDRSLVGQRIRLSEDCLTAEHMDAVSDAMNGVVFLSYPLPCFRIGVYFEVRVDATRIGEIDGLVIGVTKNLPDANMLPEVADTLPRSWSFGYDGHARGPGRQMSPIDWQPKDLKIGDRVGLLIRPRGTAHLVINRARAVELPSKVPFVQPLYGFVDLLGSTKVVSLLQGARPPRFLDAERAAALTNRRVSFAESVEWTVSL